MLNRLDWPALSWEILGERRVLIDVLVVHYLKGYVELLREPTSVIEVLE